MSWSWGTHTFKTKDEFLKFLGQFKGKNLKVEDEGGYRTISEEQTGLLADVRKLHRVVSASGRVWHSSWYRPEYPHKAKTLKQRLRELEPAE